MGNYQNSNDGMDVFIRMEDPSAGQPEPIRPPPNQNRSFFSVINGLLLLLILVAAVGSAWYVYRPNLTMTQPLEEAYPFQTSAQYALTYPQIVALVGADPLARDASDTAITSQFGNGNASIHLTISGQSGQTEVWFGWKQQDEAWTVTSASFLNGEERMQIPLGPNGFLSNADMAAWHAADPSTPLGKGERGLITGQTFESLRYLNQVVEAEPDNAEALVWRGRAFEAMGNHRKALADYQRVLSFDPTNAAALGRLDAMRASLPPGSAPPAPPLRLEPLVPQPNTTPSSLIPN